MSDIHSELIERATKGDQEAAAQLVTLFYARIYAWLRRLTGQDEEAADLTQRTFVRFWQSLPKFEGRSSVSTWLHGIGHHVYLDWRRQPRRQESYPDEWWARCPDEGSSPATNASDRDLAVQLHALVERFEEDTRVTVHLHYYEGLSLAETAEVLGVASSTVKYRLRQAIQSLRAQLSEPKPR